jgi:pimeloyl-ACP methyl ester carboxylesterase
MSAPSATGSVLVNGAELYWEQYGSGGTPLVLVPGGYGVISMSSRLIDALARRRLVVAVELQGHGHARDTGREFSYEAFGDDIAALIGQLGLEQADLLGDSLGAGACLRVAIQHPAAVRRLAVVSFPYCRDGWFPEVRAAFDQMSSAGFAQMRHTPLYAEYSRVAPDPDAFPALMDQIGQLQRRPYDWSEEIKRLRPPTLLVFADADSMPASHIAEFYALLGGGLSDAGWDNSGRVAAQLAVLPGLNHYDIFQSGLLAAVAGEFFT